MSLQLHPLEPIPELTARIARTSFPKGTLVMQLRDALGPIYHDIQFAHLFPKRGRVAHAPWRLAMVTILQAAENLSDQQAAEMVRGRLDWKYALSLPLDDQGFDASILGDFRARLVEHQAQELLLEPILQVCREHGWLKAGGTQRVDSTVVVANVRRLSSLESVAETLRAALNVLAELDPDWLLSVITADWFDRYVHRFELQRFPKAKAAQEQLLEQVGQDSWQVLQAAKQAAPAVSTHPAVALLQQVWNQHFEQVAGSVQWRDGPAVCNQQRVVSPYDQQARESRKRDTEWLGFKVHLTETCDPEQAVHLIVDVSTTPATTQDVQETRAILHRLAAHDLTPETLLADSGYTSAEMLVEQEQQGVRLIGPVHQDSSWQEQTGYGQQRFGVDWQARRARCPQGHSSQTWKPSTDKDGRVSIQVGFAPSICQRCEVKAQCTTSQKGGRTLTLLAQSVYEKLQQRRGEQHTKAFQQEYASRAGVESCISEGVRAHGMRRSRYQGIPKTQLQMTAIAAAINLVRLRSMVQRTQAGLPPRRKRAPSPFARLHERNTV